MRVLVLVITLSYRNPCTGPGASYPRGVGCLGCQGGPALEPMMHHIDLLA